MSEVAITTTVKKLQRLTKRYKVVQGATWAGKTFAILIILIDRAIRNPNLRITVVAETVPAVKSGAFNDFKTILRGSGRWNESYLNRSERIYDFQNGSVIEFKAFDDVSKAEADGKRDILFINEAPYLPFEIAWALIGRTALECWFDYNPRWRSWVHDEILQLPDVDFIILLPKHNEALPASIKAIHDQARIKAATSTFWANWCRVYLDGEIGNTEGLVFDYTNIILIDEFPKDIAHVYGMDFGFTAPATLQKVAMTAGAVYIEQMFYRSGMLEQDFKREFERIEKHIKVIADSEAPDKISYLNKLGYNVQPAKKGKGSIDFGIQTLQARRIYITKNSVETIKEFRGLMYATDKNNKTIEGKYIGDDHSVDAVRYGCSVYTERASVGLGSISF